MSGRGAGSFGVCSIPLERDADWWVPEHYFVEVASVIRRAELGGGITTASPPSPSAGSQRCRVARPCAQANLEGAQFAKVRLSNTNLTNANFANADLTDAWLGGADLSGATLTGANLNGAGLSGATLTGVTSGGIQGTPASLPIGWTLVDGVLVGP